MRLHRNPSLFLLVLCSLAFGCRSKIPEPEAAQPVATAPAPQATPAEPAAQPTPAIAAPAAPQPREGWSEVSVANKLSLCMFADAGEREHVQSVVGVKRQLLQADRPLTVGVFAPHCINPKCDEMTSLQCSIERSGNILRLQTSYLGLHKDGATCSDGCRDVRAGCESPSLEAGQYIIEYGGNQIPLKIPSALNMPCFAKR